jgi:hypothetical protein
MGIFLIIGVPEAAPFFQSISQAPTWEILDLEAPASLRYNTTRLRINIPHS